MCKILITGSNSKIAHEFSKLLSKKTTIHKLNKKSFNMININKISSEKKFFEKFDMVFFFHSSISNQRINLNDTNKIIDSLKINLVSQIMISEIILNKNKNCTIFFVGSESGIKGSYDLIYGLTKSSINKYVEERKIKFPGQRIICLAPSTIIDSKLTKKRKDQFNVKKSIRKNPKKRGLKSKEVAEIINNIAFKKEFQYLTNTVINLNGGKFARS